MFRQLAGAWLSPPPCHRPGWGCPPSLRWEPAGAGWATLLASLRWPPGLGWPPSTGGCPCLTCCGSSQPRALSLPVLFRVAFAHLGAPQEITEMLAGGSRFRLKATSPWLSAAQGLDEGRKQPQQLQPDELTSFSTPENVLTKRIGEHRKNVG